MRAVDIIEKKRDGEQLNEQEIAFMIRGYTNGEIPDYQMSAWLMTIYYKGMNAEETAVLTLEMARSGDQINLSSISGIKVDKHSTGGVGDTTTIILAPLVAAAGIPVAKMSGRGLGHTGGTIDKLEAIPGFLVEQTKTQFVQQVNEIGISLISQTGNIAPADKKLYALRDVTGTVNSIPLIASSIMSKKIASGADAIVLDVKAGPGAFMQTTEDALELAQAMTAIGAQVGRSTVAFISNMSQPLGRAIGNALEIEEALATLRGEGPSDLTELCLKLGAQMLILGGVCKKIADAEALLQRMLTDGTALNKWSQWIERQGGDPAFIHDPCLLPRAAKVRRVCAGQNGFVQEINAKQLGHAAMLLGAGRRTKSSEIDLAAGLILHKKVGDYVQKGDALAEMHWNDEEIDCNEIEQQIMNSYVVGANSAPAEKLILANVTADGTEMFI